MSYDEQFVDDEAFEFTFPDVLQLTKQQQDSDNTGVECNICLITGEHSKQEDTIDSSEYKTHTDRKILHRSRQTFKISNKN